MTIDMITKIIKLNIYLATLKFNSWTSFRHRNLCLKVKRL